MNRYTLNILIDQKGRNFFEKYQQKVILIRAIDAQETYQIVCATIAPFGEKTMLTFTDDWMTYATDDPLKANSIIVFKDQLKADLNQSYSYESLGFVASSDPAPPAAIQIANNRPGFESIVFGLGQQVDIGDGQGAKYRSLSVQESPFNQSFDFTPNQSLWIFAASDISENMLILTNALRSANSRYRTNERSPSIVIGKYLAIEIGETETIHFDTKLNLFKEGPLPTNR